MKFTDETQQNKGILLVLSTNYSVDAEKSLNVFSAQLKSAQSKKIGHFQ